MPMNAHILAAVFMLILLSVVLSGCTESATEPVNHRPVIESLTATPEIVPANGISRLECEGSDQDGDSLSYWWSSDDGSFAGARTQSSIFWLAPNAHGIHTISIRVSDGMSTVFDSVDVATIDQ
jgi:hypothetical protein